MKSSTLVRIRNPVSPFKYLSLSCLVFPSPNLSTRWERRLGLRKFQEGDPDRTINSPLMFWAWDSWSALLCKKLPNWSFRDIGRVIRHVFISLSETLPCSNATRTLRTRFAYFSSNCLISSSRPMSGCACALSIWYVGCWEDRFSAGKSAPTLLCGVTGVGRVEGVRGVASGGVVSRSIVEKG